MAIDILGKLRELLTLADADGGAGEGELPGDGEAIRPTDPPATEVIPADPAGDPAEPAAAPAEADPATGPAAGAGASDPAEAIADENGETLPESEVAESELRESLVTLGTENERLRNLVLDLGGDPDALPDVPEVEADELGDEYDDEAAEADLAEQKAAIAALLGQD